MNAIKIRPYSLLAILILLCALTGWAEKAESIKKKEYNKSFNVSLSDRLEVDNRFGNITITHWNKNEVSIQVVVEAKARNDEKAQASIDRVQIEMGKSGNIVSAITTLKEQKWSNNNNERLTINYYINIPSKFPISLSQKYGNINLPEKNEGTCSLLVKYGNINGGSFTAPLNLEAAYGNVDLGNMEKVNLDLAYCGNVTIKSATSLYIDSKYSNLNLGIIQTMTLENKYGNLSVEQVDNANVSIKYSEASIYKLTQKLTVDALDYSTLSIKELSSDFTFVNVNARYGNLNLNIPSNASFTVNAEDMKYGKYDIKGFNITSSDVEEKRNYRSVINGGKNGKILFEGNNFSNLNIRTK